MVVVWMMDVQKSGTAGKPTPKQLKQDGTQTGTTRAQDCRWEIYRYHGEYFKVQPEAGWVHGHNPNGES